MYLVVIMAFAFVLTDDLPPARLNLLGGPPWLEGRILTGTLLVAVGQVLVVAATALVSRRRTLARLGGAGESHDQAAATFAACQRVLLALIAGALIGTMILTPWVPLVRQGCHLGRWPLDQIPLLSELLLLAPFFTSLLVTWIILHPVELRIRFPGLGLPETTPTDVTQPRHAAAAAALAAATRKRPLAQPTLCLHLLDKFRHQVLVIAAPMMLIILAKHLTDRYERPLQRWSSLPWAADAALGLLSLGILALTPVLLRYIWSTEPLPAGALRDHFIRTCKHTGLRYREILLWHTHGTTINAAVMGFLAPLRYVLISDALLETMDEDEIQAVFAHEAGHVRHWHLPFFGLFALVSMYVSGGVIIGLSLVGLFREPPDSSLIQLIGLAVLLLTWWFGFGWVSQRFERQADVHGVRCVTADVRACVERCPVHGAARSTGLCTSAANLFGRTLLKIAELNGIPRDASSWRHGSIESRCRLIEELAADGTKVRRFDRSILRVKIGLLATSLLGTIVAGFVYGPDILRALHR
jgi:STE24 endopeptidase